MLQESYSGGFVHANLGISYEEVLAFTIIWTIDFLFAKIMTSKQKKTNKNPKQTSKQTNKNIFTV